MWRISRPENQPRARGMALVMVMCLLTMLAAMAASLLTMALANKNEIQNTQDRYQALLLAQAGIQMAISELNGPADSTGKPTGVPTVMFGGPSPGNSPTAGIQWGSQMLINYTSTPSPAVNPVSYTITSTGTWCHDVVAGMDFSSTSALYMIVKRQMIAVVYQAGGSGPGGFVAGGFGKSSLYLNGNANTDSWDSSLKDKNGNLLSYAQQVAAIGTQAQYDANVISHNGNVASNGNITFSGGNGLVRGNATPGPGHTVSSPSQVTGSTAPASSIINYNTPTYAPTPAAANGSFSGTTLAAGNYHYTSLSLSGQSTLTFTGPGTTNLYIDGSVSTTGKAQIIVNAGASVNFYQGDASFQIAGNGVTNNNTTPSTFNVISTSTSTVKVAGNGNIWATVYAPSAGVTITGNGDIYGAFIGNTVEIKGNGTFHYDRNAKSPGIVQYTLWTLGGVYENDTP